MSKAKHEKVPLTSAPAKRMSREELTIQNGRGAFRKFFDTFVPGFLPPLVEDKSQQKSASDAQASTEQESPEDHGTKAVETTKEKKETKAHAKDEKHEKKSEGHH